MSDHKKAKDGQTGALGDRVSQLETQRVLRAETQKKLRLLLIGSVGFLAVALGIAALVELSPDGSPDGPTGAVETSSIKAEAEAAWEHVRVAAALCDQGRTGLERLVQQGATDADLNRAVENAEAGCREGRERLHQAQPPEGVTTEVRTSFEVALRSCSDAANFKTRSLSRLRGLIDGERSPSRVAAYRETLEYIEAAQAECESGLEAAVVMVGGVVPRVANYITQAAEDGLTPEQAAAPSEGQ